MKTMEIVTCQGINDGNVTEETEPSNLQILAPAAAPSTTTTNNNNNTSSDEEKLDVQIDSKDLPAKSQACPSEIFYGIGNIKKRNARTAKLDTKNDREEARKHYASWTDEMTTFLLEILVTEKRKGNVTFSGFFTNWTSIVETFNAKFQCSYSMRQTQSQFRRERAKYDFYINLLNIPGEQFKLNKSANKVEASAKSWHEVEQKYKHQRHRVRYSRQLRWESYTNVTLLEELFDDRRDFRNPKSRKKGRQEAIVDDKQNNNTTISTLLVNNNPNDTIETPKNPKSKLHKSRLSLWENQKTKFLLETLVTERHKYLLNNKPQNQNYIDYCGRRMPSSDWTFILTTLNEKFYAKDHHVDVDNNNNDHHHHHHHQMYTIKQIKTKVGNERAKYKLFCDLLNIPNKKFKFNPDTLRLQAQEKEWACVEKTLKMREAVFLNQLKLDPYNNIELLSILFDGWVESHGVPIPDITTTTTKQSSIDNNKKRKSLPVLFDQNKNRAKRRRHQARCSGSSSSSSSSSDSSSVDSSNDTTDATSTLDHDKSLKKRLLDYTQPINQNTIQTLLVNHNKTPPTTTTTSIDPLYTCSPDTIKLAIDTLEKLVVDKDKKKTLYIEKLKEGNVAVGFLGIYCDQIKLRYLDTLLG